MCLEYILYILSCVQGLGFRLLPFVRLFTFVQLNLYHGKTSRFLKNVPLFAILGHFNTKLESKNKNMIIMLRGPSFSCECH